MKSSNQSFRRAVIIGPCILLIAGITIIYVLRKELIGIDFKEVTNNDHLGCYILACVCVATFIICEGINIRRGIELTGNKTSLAEAVKYAVAGFFFSSITPSASGGQPAQLVYMKRDGIHITSGTFALLAELMCFEIGSVVWGIIGVTMLVNTDGFSKSGIIIGLFIVGFVINVIAVVLLAMLVFSSKFTRFAARVICSIMGLIKPGYNKFKILRGISEYRCAAVKLRRNTVILAKMIATSIFQMAMLHSVTYFCMKAAGISDVTWLTAVGLQGLLFVSVSSLPLPGGAGVTESGFMVILAAVIPRALLAGTMVAVRVISFVIPVFVTGVILLGYEIHRTHIYRRSEIRKIA